MGFDLYRENENLDGEKHQFGAKDYFRWNIWGFPPIRFLGELYGWVPMGTISPSWTDDDGIEHGESECGYDTNDGQVVTAKDAQNWADALKEGVKDLVPNKNIDTGGRIDDDFMRERKSIWDKDPDAIRNWFNTIDDIDYVLDFISFLERGEFRIY